MKALLKKETLDKALSDAINDELFKMGALTPRLKKSKKSLVNIN